MKRRILIAIYAAHLGVLAGVAGAGELEIVPPAEPIEAGRHYLLSVTGLTVTDLKRTQVVVEPKGTTSAVGVTGWAGEQFLWFSAADNGRRFLAVIVGQEFANKKPTVATLLLEVGPAPPPPPPPPPPGELTIVAVYETTDRTPQEATVLLGLRKYLESRKLSFRLHDKDLKDSSTGRAPKWFVAPRAAAVAKGLPALVVGSVDSGDGTFSVVATEKLPDTIQAAVDIVKRHEPTGKSSLFVPTPLDVIQRMLAEAHVCRSDVLVDLGSGDGRIVVTAAKQYGCRAVGHELDGELVSESRRAAELAGVSDRVTIHQQDAREADLTLATVVTLYLDESLNAHLVPQLLRLRPGARVVSHAHKMPGLPAERTVSIVSNADGQEHELFLCTIPPSTVRTPGPRHAGPHGSCLMCLGNHLQSTHKIPRSRLDAVGYRRWSTLHDNHHNHKEPVACAL